MEETFLPGSNTLVDSVDRRLMVTLRDGRKLFGILRTYDQFANLVLQDCIERVYHNQTYGETHRGVFVIRGENVVLLGEVDSDSEEAIHATLQRLPHAEVLSSIKEESQARKEIQKKKSAILHDRKGFSVDVVEGDHY